LLSLPQSDNRSYIITIIINHRRRHHHFTCSNTDHNSKTLTIVIRTSLCRQQRLTLLPWFSRIPVSLLTYIKNISGPMPLAYPRHEIYWPARELNQATLIDRSGPVRTVTVTKRI